jgi:hypothetical protein
MTTIIPDRGSTLATMRLPGADPAAGGVAPTIYTRHQLVRLMRDYQRLLQRHQDALDAIENVMASSEQRPSPAALLQRAVARRNLERFRQQHAGLVQLQWVIEACH